MKLVGTKFQLKVWAYLKKIPRGSIKTYSQVAKAIGKPLAVRAVAHHACLRPAVAAFGNDAAAVPATWPVLPGWCESEALSGLTSESFTARAAPGRRP